MSENLYDPHYHGALSVYLRTPEVRYVLIDPATRTYTEGKLPRGELREGIVALLGTEDIIKVEMDDDDRLTIMALHNLYVACTPAPDGGTSGIARSTPSVRRATPGERGSSRTAVTATAPSVAASRRKAASECSHARNRCPILKTSRSSA